MFIQKRRVLALACAGIAGLSIEVKSAHATQANWLTASSGNYTTGSKWSTSPHAPVNGSPTGTTYDATIGATGSLYTVTLGSDVTVNSLTLNAASATLSQTGGTLQAINGLNLSAGTYQLMGGEISSTTISSTGGTLKVASASLGTLNNVTLDAALALADNALFVTNGITLNNTITLNSNTGEAEMVFSNNDDLTSTSAGTVVFDGSNGEDVVIDNDGAPLTFDSNITVKTGTDAGAISASGLINNGTILAATSGKTLTVSNGQSLTNNGTLLATAGTLNIAGTVTTAGLGYFSANGGTVQISGTLDNTGANLNLAGGTQTLYLAGGTLNGGTISGTGLAIAPLSYATFDGVILDTDFALNDNTLFVTNGITLNNHTITLNSNASEAELVFNTNDLLTGTGTVVFNGSNGEDFVEANDGGTLTIDSNITVKTGTDAGAISASGLINNGTILAGASGKTLTVSNGQSLTNSGTLLATAGTLNIAGTVTTAGLGYFSANGGTVQISGTLDNTGANLNLAGGTQTLYLAGGTLSGGTISGTGLAIAPLSYATFDGVTLDTDYALTDNTLFVTNGITLNNRTITLNSNTSEAELVFNTNDLLTGTGTVVFNGSNGEDVVLANDGGTLTIDSNITVKTGTDGGTIYASGLINNGTILAQSGHTLTVNSPFTNNGTLMASSSGRLLMSGTMDLSGTGTIASNTGGVVEINGAVQAPANVTSTLNVSAGTALLSGTLNVGTNAILQKLGTGTLILAGLQSWAPGSTLEMAGGVADIQSNPGGNVTLHVNATTLHFQGGISNPILKAAGLQINTPGDAIIDPGGQTTVTTQTLHIDVNDGGKMDLNDNKLVIDYDPTSGNNDPIDTIKGYIQHAYDGGAWDGTGLGSTTAMNVAADSTNPHKTGVGYAEASAIYGGISHAFGAATVDSTAIVTGYTYLGDANMDGTVNALDLNAVATDFGKPGYWYQGDFNYDGTVNIQDFNAIAENFGESLPTSAPALGATPLGALVPEPVGMMATVIGLGMMSRRRRR
jgi:hypothetical protein